MGELWAIILMPALILGIIPAIIASNKGKDFLTWYIYGVLLFFFAMIHAIVLPEKRQDSQTLSNDIQDNKVALKDVSTPSIYNEPQLVNPKSPVGLESYELKITKDENKAFVKLTLHNFSEKTLNAVKIKILCFDSFDEPIGSNENNYIETIIQDLKVLPGNYFGKNKLIELKGFEETRKIKVIIKNILLEDGSKWEYDENDLVEVIIEKPQDEELEKLKAVAGEDAICYAKEEANYWICVCGRVNVSEYVNCIRCGRNHKEALQNWTDKDIISETYKQIKEEEDIIRQNKIREEEEYNKKRSKKRKAIIIVALIASFFMVIWLVNEEFNKPTIVTGIDYDFETQTFFQRHSTFSNDNQIDIEITQNNPFGSGSILKLKVINLENNSIEDETISRIDSDTSNLWWVRIPPLEAGIYNIHFYIDDRLRANTEIKVVFSK